MLHSVKEGGTSGDDLLYIDLCRNSNSILPPTATTYLKNPRGGLVGLDQLTCL